MGNLTATNQWVDVPYFEPNAVLTGGPDCPDNVPIQALADRTEYLNQHKQEGLGFVPVQQGTGVGQSNNVIKLGWSGTRLLATVDAVDQGPIVFDTQLNAAIKAAIDGLVSGAPGALDTLKELAVALDNDANFAATMTNALASKQAVLGYTPVQQGTGVGQNSSNRVKIGWNSSRLCATVDTTDLGNIVFDQQLNDRLPNRPVLCMGAPNMGDNRVYIGWNGTTSRLIAQVDAVALGELMTDELLVGSIMMFATATVPPGFLKCNGAAISRTAYSRLFNRIGTLYGSGDGSTTFNVPDARGVFPRFTDDGAGTDPGRILGTIQGDAMQRIRGTLGVTNGGYYSVTGAFSASTSTTGPHISTSTIGTDYAINFDSGYVTRTANETRPINLSLMACIKY